MTHSFFIAVNKFWLGLKTSHRTILQTCRLSPSDVEISPFYFNSPRLPVSANNLPGFEKISNALRQKSSYQIIRNTRFFFIRYAFFPTQSQCCLTCSWIELQMLLRCCLIHVSSIILKHFLHLLYLGLGLFMSYLCDVFFIFIFIMVNRVISWIQTHLLFCLFFIICSITFGRERWWRMWMIFK